MNYREMRETSKRIFEEFKGLNQV